MQRSLTHSPPLLLVLGALAVPLMVVTPAISAPAVSPTYAFAPLTAPLALSSPFAPLWSSSAPGTAGMLAFYNPETGTVGGPTGPFGGIGVESTDWQAGLVEEASWDGSPMVNLKGQLQDYATMQLTPDGRLVLICSPNPNASLNTLVAPVTKPVEE